MARTKQFNMSLGTMKIRSISGWSAYWGHGADVLSASFDFPTPTNNDNNPIPVMLSDPSGTAPVPGGNQKMLARNIFKVDLLSLPVNAYIQSAIFTFYIEWSQCRTDAYPMPLSVYRIFNTPNITNCNFRYYDSALLIEWSRYGLVDGVDYKAQEEGSAVLSLSDLGAFVGNPLPPVQGGVRQFIPKSIDLTNFARYVMNTDTRQMYFDFTRSDAHKRAWVYLYDGTIPDVGGSYAGNTAVRPNVGYEPTLTITYLDALTFHPSHDDGTIDETQVIDTTAAGIWLFDALRVGGLGQPRKFWVKNNTTGSAPQLNVYSQRSYGDLVPLITRSTVGNGTISDIGTVDKSVNQTNYTHTEQWRITFTSATAFSVEHDNGTVDDPSLVDTWIAANPASGSVGSLYTDTNTGVNFLVTAGGTAFVVTDRFQWRTYEDDAQAAAPADSDFYLTICADASNAPAGNFQPMTWKPVRVSSNVVTDTVVPVSDTTVFKNGTQVEFIARATAGSLGFRTVLTVVPGASITVSTPISLTALDYAIPVRVGVNELLANQAMPFWIQTTAPVTATRETKLPRWRAQSL